MKTIYYNGENQILKEELLKGFIVTLSNDKKYQVLFNEDNIRNESELSYCLSRENEYDFITITTLTNQTKLLMKNQIINIELINIIKIKFKNNKSDEFINYYKLNLLEKKYKLNKIKIELGNELSLTLPFYTIILNKNRK